MTANTTEYKLTADELANIFAGHPIDLDKLNTLIANLNNCFDEKTNYLNMATQLKDTNDPFIIHSMLQSEREINERYAAALREYTHYRYSSIVDPAINAYAAYINDPNAKLTETDICMYSMEYMDETPIDDYFNKSNADEVLTHAIDDFMSYIAKRSPDYKPNWGKMFENEKTVTPDKAVIITDKPYTKMFNRNESGLFYFDVGENNFPITRIVQLDYSALDGLEVLNEYDRSTCDAIVTHVAAGNKFMTKQMLYRVMTRNPNARLTKDMSDWDDIDKSIRKLIRTIYKADITEEARFYQRLNNLQLEVEEPIVLGRIVTAKELNGQQIDSVLQVVDEPIVLRIAKAKGQLQPVSIKSIAAPVNKNKFSLRVQDYLERWIVWKQHDNNKHEELAAKNDEMPRQFPLAKRTLLLETLSKEVIEQQPIDPNPDELRKYKERIKKQKQRLNTLIPDYLTSYCKNDKNDFYIYAYVMDSERIRIAFNPEQAQGLKKYVINKSMSYIP